MFSNNYIENTNEKLHIGASNNSRVIRAGKSETPLCCWAGNELRKGFFALFFRPFLCTFPGLLLLSSTLLLFSFLTAENRTTSPQRALPTLLSLPLLLPLFNLAVSGVASAQAQRQRTGATVNRRGQGTRRRRGRRWRRRRKEKTRK